MRQFIKILIFFLVILSTVGSRIQSAQAYYWSFGLGVGGLGVHVSSWSYLDFGWGWPWHYLYPTVSLTPFYYRPIRYPKMSVAQQNRYHDQLVTLLKEKMTAYYAHKIRTEAARILEEKKVDAEFIDSTKTDSDTPVKENTPSNETDLPSHNVTPQETTVSRDGSVVINYY